MIPWLLVMFLLYSNKLFAFSLYSRTWFRVWSGLRDVDDTGDRDLTSQTLEDEDEHRAIVDVEFFNEQSLFCVLLQSVPQFVLQLYNVYRLNHITTIALFSLSMSLAAAINIFYRIVYYRLLRKMELKDVPNVLSELNQIAADHHKSEVSSRKSSKVPSLSDPESVMNRSLQSRNLTTGRKQKVTIVGQDGEITRSPLQLDAGDGEDPFRGSSSRRGSARGSVSRMLSMDFGAFAFSNYLRGDPNKDEHDDSRKSKRKGAKRRQGSSDENLDDEEGEEEEALIAKVMERCQSQQAALYEQWQAQWRNELQAALSQQQLLREETKNDDQEESVAVHQQLVPAQQLMSLQQTVEELQARLNALEGRSG